MLVHYTSFPTLELILTFPQSPLLSHDIDLEATRSRLTHVAHHGHLMPTI
jgi:hypothetical protein